MTEEIALSQLNIRKVGSYEQWDSLYKNGTIGENDLVIIPPGQIQKKLNQLETGTLPIKQISILEELPNNFDSTYDEYLVTAAVLKAYIDSRLNPNNEPSGNE